MLLRPRKSGVAVEFLGLIWYRSGADQTARSKAPGNSRDNGDREGSGMWSDFKAFINRGNIVDLAVGFILGVAFAAIVNSLVNDIIMPVVGLGTGRDFSSLFAVIKQGKHRVRTTP